MPLVEAVALADFVHGDINATEGKLVRHRGGGLIDSGIAGDLERANLIRIRMTPTVAVQAQGKVPDDGAGQPSSSSPVAPALQPMTSNTLSLGDRKIRKPGV